MVHHCDKTKQHYQEGIITDMSNIYQAHPKLRRQGYIQSPLGVLTQSRSALADSSEDS